MHQNQSRDARLQSTINCQNKILLYSLLSFALLRLKLPWFMQNILGKLSSITTKQFQFKTFCNKPKQTMSRAVSFECASMKCIFLWQDNYINENDTLFSSLIHAEIFIKMLSVSGSVSVKRQLQYGFWIVTKATLEYMLLIYWFFSYCSQYKSSFSLLF